MIGTALICSALLFALGPIFYFMGTHHSPTAFIPSVFGVFIAAFALAAKNPARTKAAMHGAVGFALLGVFGSLRGLKNWPLILTGRADGLTNSATLAAWSTLFMFVICLFLVVASGKWFMSNRRARQAAE